MPKDWRNLLLWGGCTFFAGWILWWASAGYPLEGPICPGESTNDNCARYNVIFYSAWQIAQFASHWSVLITAAATVAIGYFTLTLKESTDKLWQASEGQLKHAQTEAASAEAVHNVQSGQISEQIEVLRQSADAAVRSEIATRDLVRTTRENVQPELRTYIGIEWARIASNDGGTTFLVEIQIRNTGKTPAFRVTHCIASQVFPRNQRLNLAVPIRNPGNLPIAPSMSFVMRTPVVLGVSEVPSIDSRQRCIVGWGRVDYFDFFGFPHYLTFRFRSADAIRSHDGTIMRTVGWRMDADDEGNDCN